MKLNAEKIEQKVAAHRLTRALFSQSCLAFVYGLYLCMYDVKFLDDWIAPFHFLLIGWTAVITAYNVAVRKIWKKLPAWQWLALFFLSAGITTLLNMETGLVSNVKSWVLTSLPLCAFLPACFHDDPAARKRIFFSALLGAAAVAFAASAVSLFAYLIRFDKAVTLLGVTEDVGIRWLDEGGGLSVLLYGVYLDPNYAAALSVFFAVYSAALFMACRKGLYAKGWKNVLGQWFAAANLLVQACYFPLANSRGAWLSLAAAGTAAGFMYLYCVMLRKGSKTRRGLLAFVMAAAFMAVVCVGLVGLRNTLSYFSAQSVSTNAAESTGEAETGEVYVDSFVKQDDGTGSGRLTIWKEAMSLFVRRPLFGTAPRNNQYYTLKYGLDSVKISAGTGVHNSYLDVLVEYGAAGAVLLFVFFAVCMVNVLRRVFGGQEKEGTYYLIIFGALVICCASAFLSAAFINTTALYYLMLMPIGYLIPLRNSEHEGANK